MPRRDLRLPVVGGLALATVAAQAWLPTAWVGPRSLLLIVVPAMVATTLAVIRPVTARELAFRRYWLGGFVLWWLSAALGLAAVLPVLWTDSLRLLGYIGIALALATRPHRAIDGRMTGPVRQLQLSGVLLVLLALALYGPGLTSGRLADFERAWVDLVFAAVAAWLWWRPTARAWRGHYARMIVGFGLFCIAGFAAEHLVSVATVATAGALFVLATVPLRVVGEEEMVGVFTRGEDDGRRLPADVPVFLVAGLVSAMHLTLDLFGVTLPGPTGPEIEASRGAIALGSLLVLGALAIAEHALLRRRATSLEHARDRAADEEAEKSIYLTSLIEHSPLAIVVLNPDHVVQLCNPAFERLFDYESSEVVGTSLDRLIAPGEQAIEAQVYTRTVLSGDTVHDTTFRLRRDGTPVDVEIHGVPLMKDGQLVGIFALYQDVTKRIRAEQAMRESEERFRRLSDATFEGIVVSEEGRIIDCNEQYANLVGLSQDDVLGRKVLDFVDPMDHAMVRRHLDEDDDQRYEHRALRADRSARIVEVHGRNMPWSGRRVRVAAVRDVTAQRRFEEEVRQSQKMEAVGRLAGGIAHDFNNLLTVIKGYAQLLALQMAGDRRGTLVDEIVQATDRASLMTQRLLAFGRKQPFQPQMLDLGDAVRSMEKILRRLIRADIELVLDLAENDVQVQVDPSQFEQVVLNLAINAADAMPGGGTLTLTTDAVDFGKDATAPGASGLPGGHSGLHVRLRVRDTGTGMDEETRAQVFEPFFTTKGQGKGTGLGLATVYAIVHQSGGWIEVESAPEQGSEFIIVWPQGSRSMPDTVLDAPSGIQEASRIANLPTGSETVLVVEDESGVRALAREFLELQGYEVHVAEDGSEGLKRFAALSGAVDLVLTDVVMPGINGPEMVDRLRVDRPDLRVLYMSGYTDEVLGDADPSVVLVHKPFSVDELVTKVREILDGEASSG
ncbi:MAG: PAS domain S-box protein [Acidobacteriota bacterium]